MNIVNINNAKRSKVRSSGVSKPGPSQAWALVKLADAWVKQFHCRYVCWSRTLN